MAQATQARPRSVAIIGTRGYPSYYGGFETLVRRLAPFLADQGWTVTVYGRRSSVLDDDPGRDARVVSTTTWGLDRKALSTLTHGFTACLHAAWRKPDVALVMNVANGYWLPILRLRGVPTVVNVDGIEWERAKWGKAAKRVFRWGATLTARFADALVYDSAEIERRWVAESERKGSVIAYGGDTPADLPVVAGLEHRRYALIVARFVPENTVPEFFEAARAISEHVDVVIVGSSGYGGALETRAKHLTASNPRIHWLGHISDDEKLFSLWQHAAAYFHGHSVGGTNPALVQAMACGAPTVARDTPYNREVLGPVGTYVPPDPKAIAAAVVSLAKDEARQTEASDAFTRRANDRYSWAKICRDYETTLEAVFPTSAKGGRSTRLRRGLPELSPATRRT